MTQVKVSKRLNDAPAVIVSPFPASMKSYFQLMEPSQLEAFKTNHTLEINPNHKIIVGLNKLRRVNLSAANTVLLQLLDNTLLSCGLLVDPTDSVNRVNSLILNTIDLSLRKDHIEQSKDAHRDSVPADSNESKSSDSNTVDRESILKEALEKMKENAKNNNKQE